MNYLRKYILLLCILFPFIAQGQFPFSLSTDLSLLRNFDGQQPITVIGQTVRGEWHIDNKSTVMVSFSYHSNGKYKSTLLASAKSPSTNPQSFEFTNRSEMRIKQFALGFKQYFTGNFQKTEKLSIYGIGGFGLILGQASNNFSAPVDTSLYTIQQNVINGSGDFKRLSLDLAGGIEFPVAYEIFVFSEGRIHIPTTRYPNSYLLKNNNAPFLGSLNVGIRVLFNDKE